MPGQHGSSISECRCSEVELDPIGRPGETNSALRWINNRVSLRESDAIGSRCSSSSSCAQLEWLLRPSAKRLLDEPYLISNSDATAPSSVMLFTLFFECPVDVLSLTFISGQGPFQAETFSAYPDIPAGIESTDELETPRVKDCAIARGDLCGAVKHPLKPMYFSGINSLGIVVRGSSTFHLHWLGLWGRTRARQLAPVSVVYETLPNPSERQKIPDRGGAIV